MQQPSLQGRPATALQAVPAQKVSPESLQSLAAIKPPSHLVALALRQQPSPQLAPTSEQSWLASYCKPLQAPSILPSTHLSIQQPSVHSGTAEQALALYVPVQLDWVEATQLSEVIQQPTEQLPAGCWSQAVGE